MQPARARPTEKSRLNYRLPVGTLRQPGHSINFGQAVADLGSDPNSAQRCIHGDKRISELGSDPNSAARHGAASCWPTRSSLSSTRHQSGFTLLELLVVLAIEAMASVGVGFAMRDGTQVRLEREALRLSALLESARALSQTTGVPVRWQATADGFRFDGAAADASGQTLPRQWLDADTRASIDPASSVLRPGVPSPQTDNPTLLLGPEPIIAPQAVTLASISQPQQRVRIATDGVRPFSVQDAPQ